ncbi:unnamed protein product, partial [Protopolystoma xenopodis]
TSAVGVCRGWRAAPAPRPSGRTGCAALRPTGLSVCRTTALRRPDSRVCSASVESRWILTQSCPMPYFPSLSPSVRCPDQSNRTFGGHEVVCSRNATQRVDSELGRTMDGAAVKLRFRPPRSINRPSSLKKPEAQQQQQPASGHARGRREALIASVDTTRRVETLFVQPCPSRRGDTTRMPPSRCDQTRHIGTHQH